MMLADFFATPGYFRDKEKIKTVKNPHQLLKISLTSSTLCLVLYGGYILVCTT